jgi:hypothetical protein
VVAPGDPAWGVGGAGFWGTGLGPSVGRETGTWGEGPWAPAGREGASGGDEPLKKNKRFRNEKINKKHKCGIIPLGKVSLKIKRSGNPERNKFVKI